MIYGTRRNEYHCTNIIRVEDPNIAMGYRLYFLVKMST